MDRGKMSKSAGNATKPSPSLSEFSVDSMRFSLLHRGGITDDGGYDARIVISYKDGCANGMGNLGGHIPGWKFDLERAVKRSVEFTLSEPPPEDQGHYSLLEMPPPVTGEKFEGLQRNLALKDVIKRPAIRAIPDSAQQDLPVYLSGEAVPIAGIFPLVCMPSKVKQVLDGSDVRADVPGSGLAFVSGDR